MATLLRVSTFCGWSTLALRLSICWLLAWTAPLVTMATPLRTDTTQTAYSQLIKFGLRGGNVTGRVLIPQLRYEGQLRPAWSVQVGTGYGFRQEKLGWYRRLRTTCWTTDASVRYYLHRPSTPLTGTYVSLGFGAIRYRNEDRYNYTPVEVITTRAWLLEPRALVGKQLPMRYRLALDLYAAAIAPIYLTHVDNYSPGLELGMSLGYRR